MTRCLCDRTFDLRARVALEPDDRLHLAEPDTDARVGGLARERADVLIPLRGDEDLGRAFAPWDSEWCAAAFRVLHLDPHHLREPNVAIRPTDVLQELHAVVADAALDVREVRPALRSPTRALAAAFGEGGLPTRVLNEDSAELRSLDPGLERERGQLLAREPARVEPVRGEVPGIGLRAPLHGDRRRGLLPDAFLGPLEVPKLSLVLLRERHQIDPPISCSRCSARA